MTTETTYTNEQLIQMLANATKTHYNCSGHGKAGRNEDQAAQWERLLEERGATIPDLNTLLFMGVFNGEGSC